MLPQENSKLGIGCANFVVPCKFFSIENLPGSHNQAIKGQWVNLKKLEEILKCVMVDIYVHGSNGGCVPQSA